MQLFLAKGLDATASLWAEVKQGYAGFIAPHICSPMMNKSLLLKYATAMNTFWQKWSKFLPPLKERNIMDIVHIETEIVAARIRYNEWLCYLF